MCPCARGACAWRMARAAGASAKACENFPTPRLIYHFRTQKPFLVCCHWRDHFKRSLKGDRSERSLRGKKTVLGPEMVYKAGSWKVFARFRACAPRHAPRHFLFLFFFTRTHTHAHTPQMSTSTTSTSSSTGTSSSSSSSSSSAPRRQLDLGSSSSSSSSAWSSAWQGFEAKVAALPDRAREQWEARQRAQQRPGMGPSNPSTPMFDRQFEGLSAIESRNHVLETRYRELEEKNRSLMAENGRLRCTISMYRYTPSVFEYAPSSPPYSPTEPSYAYVPSSPDTNNTPPHTPPNQIRRRDDPPTPHPQQQDVINLVTDDETVPPTPDQTIPPTPDDTEDNYYFDTEADGPTELRRSKRARRE